MSYEYMSGMGAVKTRRVMTAPAGSGYQGVLRRRPGTMQQRPGTMQQRPGTTQQRPGTTQQRRPMSEERREQLKAAACDGELCPEEKKQKVFFRAADRTKHAEITQRLNQRGCTAQCTYQGFSFYCCPPQPGQDIAPGQDPEDVPLLDPSDIDPYLTDDMMDTSAMDPFMDDMYADPYMDDAMYMQNGAMAPATLPSDAAPGAEEEKKPPWLLIGVGVAGVAVIGYLLATRK